MLLVCVKPFVQRIIERLASDAVRELWRLDPTLTGILFNFIVLR